MSVKQVKKKKTKTFTGCATCRSRKIKCDLGKPFCKRCEKSGLICAGYQINLCWSRPIKFDKYGYQIPNGSKEDGSPGGEVENERSFQRRNIDFVKYDREYETYEEMDRDLGLLHSPDYSLIENLQTWMQGPFGVFEGLINIPSDLMRKRRKLTKTKYRSIESPANGNDKKSVTHSPNIRQLSQQVPDQQQQQRQQSKTPQGNNNPQQQQLQQLHAGPGNIFEEQNKINLNNGWLSNELRYDAMLSATAATFNDNFHNFDFLSPFASNSPLPTPGNSHNHTDSLNLQPEYPFDKDLFNVLRSHQTLEQAPTPGISINNDLQQQQLNDGEVVISTSESNMPEDIFRIINVPSIPQLPPSVNVTNTGLQINPLSRFLLKYYIDSVADLMTVVAFPKNPWKTIYFPRALRALGDISGLGKTTNARASLLNALLAVACFNIQSRYEKGSNEMKFFLNLGIELRLQAASFLKKMLEPGVNELMKSEKYKDILTAILSMNTIDIVWGTMADCQYHISICEEIICKRVKERPNLSHKAKLLHRIFSFLKLVQDSTNFENLKNPEAKLKAKIDDIFIKNHDEQFSPDVNFSINADEFQDGDRSLKTKEVSSSSPTRSTYSPAFIDEIASASSNNSKVSKELLLTDALYGLPNSLILLFSDTVNLLKTKFLITNNAELDKDLEKKKVVFKKFNEFCLGFESKLLKWENEWNLKDSDSDEFLSHAHEGIYYHCMSFFNSLIIYYFTMVRDLNHLLLQKYSLNCIEYLEKLQELINTKKVRMLPLFWQGFIAGCSSMDTVLQNRFKDWAASLSKTGMGSYWGARQIMFEVWRRRELKQDNDNWFSVHRDWEMNIMLS